MNPVKYANELRAKLGLHHATKVAEKAMKNTNPSEWHLLPSNSKNPASNLFTFRKSGHSKLEKNVVNVYKLNVFWTNVFGFLSNQKER